MAISITERSSFLLIYLLAHFLNQTVAVAPSTGNAGTTVILPLSGNVYPKAYYSALLDIGQPPEPFDFSIDTSSNLTWFDECVVYCINCAKPMAQNYEPKKFVRCGDPVCDSVRRAPCKSPEDKCNYKIEYRDKSSSSGFLVTDNFPPRLTNGTVISPRLVFGCGMKQPYPKKNPPPTAGMLGFGDGKISILSQLHGAGIIKNVVGHCLDAKGGGFMFFGDVPAVPSSSNITWIPRISSSLITNHYSAGPAELFHDGKPTSSKGLQLIFDSGSTYTYLTPGLYKTAVDQIKKDVKGKSLKIIKVDPKENAHTCWESTKKPFKSISEVKRFFKPFMLKFANNKELQIPPEAYLFIDKDGDVCLGMKAGTGGIIVGDISMQDMMMIFDNEKKRIGWVSANCADIPMS